MSFYGSPQYVSTGMAVPDIPTGIIDTTQYGTPYGVPQQQMLYRPDTSQVKQTLNNILNYANELTKELYNYINHIRSTGQLVQLEKLNDQAVMNFINTANHVGNQTQGCPVLGQVQEVINALKQIGDEKSVNGLAGHYQTTRKACQKLIGYYKMYADLFNSMSGQFVQPATGFVGTGVVQNPYASAKSNNGNTIQIPAIITGTPVQPETKEQPVINPYYNKETVMKQEYRSGAVKRVYKTENGRTLQFSKLTEADLLRAGYDKFGEPLDPADASVETVIIPAPGSDLAKRIAARLQKLGNILQPTPTYQDEEDDDSDLFETANAVAQKPILKIQPQTTETKEEVSKSLEDLFGTINSRVEDIEKAEGNNTTMFNTISDKLDGLLDKMRNIESKIETHTRELSSVKDEIAAMWRKLDKPESRPQQSPAKPLTKTQEPEKSPVQVDLTQLMREEYSPGNFYKVENTKTAEIAKNISTFSKGSMKDVWYELLNAENALAIDVNDFLIKVATIAFESIFPLEGKHAEYFRNCKSDIYLLLEEFLCVEESTFYFKANRTEEIGKLNMAIAFIVANIEKLFKLVAVSTEGEESTEVAFTYTNLESDAKGIPDIPFAFASALKTTKYLAHVLNDEPLLAEIDKELKTLVDKFDKHFNICYADAYGRERQIMFTYINGILYVFEHNL